MKTTCSICGNSRQNRLFEAREMMFGTGDRFTYLECGACGCVQLLKVPTDLSPFYPDTYYSFTPPGAPPTGRKRLMKFLRNHYAATGQGLVGGLLTRYVMGPYPAMQALAPLRLKPSAALLDVGCGHGNLLRDLQEVGFTHLLGADPYIAHDLEYESGLRILKKPLDEVPGTFDLIMLHHAFEHLANPADIMRQLSTHLKPAGRVLIRIPVADSYAYHHYGADWAQLDAPRHLFLHTRKSMEILARQAGLRVENEIWDSTAFQFWGSEQYHRGVPLMDPRSYRNQPEGGLFSREEIREFTRHARALNRQGEGDQACFYLQKA